MSRGCSLARSRHRAPEIKKDIKFLTKKDEEFLELARKPLYPAVVGSNPTTPILIK